MRPRDFKGPIQPVRFAVLLRYIDYVEAVGAPVERLLACPGIPAVLRVNPMALVPQESAMRFIDLASQCLGSEHLGVYVSLAFKLDKPGVGAAHRWDFPTGFASRHPSYPEIGFDCSRSQYVPPHGAK